MAAPQIVGDIDTSVVAKGQLSVAAVRVDGTAGVCALLCDNRSARDGHVGAIATLTATDARTIVVALSIDIAAADDDDATVCILATTNTRSIHAAVFANRYRYQQRCRHLSHRRFLL